MSLDIYAPAKASLRDNVKTLMMIFSGAAGVVLAGTPFSGFGKLDTSSYFFAAAAVGLIGAFGTLSQAVYLMVKLLEPDAVYQSALLKSFDFSSVPKAHKAELTALRSEFEARKIDLLPKDVGSVDDLKRIADETWDQYQDLLESSSEEDIKKATIKEKDFKELLATEEHINQWAAFMRMSIRYRIGIRYVLWLGLIALVFLSLFSWAVASTKETKTPSIIVVNTPPTGSQPGVLPQLEPVLFDFGKSNIRPDALLIIRSARDKLKSHPDLGVLLLAYTDTKGGDHLNINLSRARADSVATLLEKQGGINKSRIFTSVLPKTDLPVVTLEDTAKAENRSVTMLLFRLPQQDSQANNTN